MLFRSITAYYGVKASLHSLNKKNVNPIYKDFDISEMVTEIGSEDMPKIIELLTDIITVPELKYNKFLSMLDFEKIMYDDKSKAGFRNRNVYNIISNSFIRLSPEEQQRVTSDYEMLKDPKSITDDKVLQDKINTFKIGRAHV